MIAQTNTDVVPASNLMEQICSGDRTATVRGIAALTPVPAIAQTVHTLDHGDVTVTVPTWATHVSGVEQPSFLGDLDISGDEIALTVDVYDPMGNTMPARFFAAHMQVEPYCGDVNARVPHVDVQVCDDEVMECLGPDDLAQLSAKLRAHADRLDQMRRDLIQTRAEWTPPTAPTYIDGIPEDLARQLRAIGLELRIDRLGDGDHALRAYLHGKQILDVRESEPGPAADAAVTAMLATLRGSRV